MSISNEINRIEAAKNSIALAIEEKGVSVPENIKIEEMADLINSIKPNLRSITIVPATEEQVFTPDGFDGYNRVVVETMEIYDGTVIDG